MDYKDLARGVKVIMARIWKEYQDFHGHGEAGRDSVYLVK